ncbi:MAG: prolyl oligopeptidase family serine peptidase [Acidobacteriota bacterium]
MIQRILLFLVCTVLQGISPATAAPSRNLTVDDYFRIREVSDPRLSPDGQWIAYAVKTRDLEEDKTESRIWMVATSGGEAIPMTAEGSSASRPRWSPDGKYLAFLAARNEDKTQVWTLFRQGGDSAQLTDTVQGVTAYQWSPDGRQMVLVLKDPSPEELEEKKDDKKKEKKVPRPWVVNRLQFKRDYVGYLDRRRTHLYVLDVASKEMTQITSGDYDDSEPAWSPDGRFIAFVSNRTKNPDHNYNSDLWLVTADNPDQGQTLLRLTTNPGPDHSPCWSPDGKSIAHVSATDTEAIVYATPHLARVSSRGGPATVLTQRLDRHVSSPRFSADGGSIYFLLEDRGELNLAVIPAAGGPVERPVHGPRVVGAFDLGRDGMLATLVSEPHRPPEVFLMKENRLEQLTHTNDELLAEVRLGDVEKIRFESKDGTAIEGFVVKPPGFDPNLRYPALLRIHGGPVAQYDFRFHYEAQLFAANGYVVVLPNPRGSSGYGQDFSLGIWQSWGDEDYEDVLASVDYIVEQGYADPDRLGVGGWSYGGMLTNHVITKTDRFRAAITGASATLYVANYGHDQYQRWWEYELGLPWENRALWERLSPFNRVERIVTPTLIVGGEKDWNVPILNSEQLYQALKRLGRETELVVYPGEYHGIRTPSYRKHLYERYLAWYDRYVKAGASTN